MDIHLSNAILDGRGITYDIEVAAVRRSGHWSSAMAARIPCPRAAPLDAGSALHVIFTNLGQPGMSHPTVIGVESNYRGENGGPGFWLDGGVSPAGLMFILLGEVDDKVPIVAVLKLEKETGIRAQPTQQGNRRYFAIQQLRDLMLTTHTRVFKTALFSARKSGLKIHASDTQQGFNVRKGVADFFLEFLGCTMAQDPRVVTQTYYNTVEKFINKVVKDPALKAQYQVALFADIQSNRGSISPGNFARAHLEEDDRKKFIDFLRHEEAPHADFRKDTELLDPVIKKMQLQFKSGITVIAAPEQFQEHVEVKSIDGGRTRVKIEDVLAELKGRA
jgi:hypothetical protein